MTLRQKAFADEYLQGGDPIDAVAKAGYRERNPLAASKRLLNTPAIKTYLEEHRTRSSGREVADASEVLCYLTEVLRGDHGGDRERLRAAELLGKRHGLFREENEEPSAAVIIVDDLHG